MKTLATFLLVCLSILTARADLAIYNNKVTVTKTGAGTVQRISITGFTVLGLDNSDFAIVKLYVARNRFSVQFPSYQYLNVSAGLGGTYDVLSIYPIGVGGLTGKGKEVSTDVGNLDLWMIPKVFKVSGTDAYTDTDNENYSQEYRGVATFDSTDTKNANIAHLTVDQVVDQIRSNLTGQGYVEE